MIHQIQFVSPDGKLAWPTYDSGAMQTANTLRRGTKWAKQVKEGDLVELTVCPKGHPGRPCDINCSSAGYAVVLWTDVETYEQALKRHAYHNHVAHLDVAEEVRSSVHTHTELRTLSASEKLQRSMEAAYGGPLDPYEPCTVLTLVRVGNLEPGDFVVA
jgi:hypothetical protein